MVTQTPPTQTPSSGPTTTPPRARVTPNRTARRRRWLPWVVAIGLLVVVLVALRVMTSQPAAPVTPAATPATARFTARGRIEPVAHARIATLTGGVVLRLEVEPGAPVVAEQELARIRGADGRVEVVTAPWAGTVTAVPVNRGDTVLPGGVIATLGDMSRLQVETTDIDEFLIGQVTIGQVVTLTVDALDQRQLTGYVRRVTLEPQTTGGGDEHYPTVIELVQVPPELRPGMTVRLRLGD